MRPANTACAVAVLLVVCTGCPSPDSNAGPDPAENRKVLPPGNQAIVPGEPVPDVYRPVDGSGMAVPFAQQTYDDGNPVRYADGSPAYIGDGTPIDYRPRNIQRAMDNLGQIYVRDIGGRPLGYEGSAQRPKITYLAAPPESHVLLPGELLNPRVDPATGDVCWRAYVCMYDDCPSGRDGPPTVFAPSQPGSRPSADGSVVTPDSRVEVGSNDDESVASWTLVKCPFCRRGDRLAYYVPPETDQRRLELEEELQRPRRERPAP